MSRRVYGRLGRAAAIALLLLAAFAAARGLERHNTWYLASDQFAFLTFAADLRSGTIFHDASFYEHLVPPSQAARSFDALFQTYFFHGGKLYSRYPPGFPALLAVAGMLGGE